MTTVSGNMTFDVGDAETFINTATVTSSTPDPNPSNNTSTVTVTVVRNESADLAIMKNGSPNPVGAGNLITYTIIVNNNGPSDAQNVMMTDQIPSSVQNPEYSLDGGMTFMAWTGSIGLGTFMVGETRSILIRGTVNEAAIGSISNTAVISSTTPDPDPSNNTSTARNIIISIFNPMLILEKSADKAYAVVGDSVTYTLRATNQGNVNLSNIRLDTVNLFDILPSQLEFIAGSVTLDGIALPEANILTGVNIGMLLVDQTKIVTFKAKVVSGEVTPITNTATGEYTYQLPEGPIQNGTAESNEVELNIRIPSLDIIKRADKQEVRLGDTITYAVQVINTGDLTAYNVLFIDKLPREVELVPGSFMIDLQVVNGVNLAKGVTLPPILPGEVVTVMYQVKVVGTNCNSLLTNKVSVVFRYRFPDGTGGTLTETGEATVKLMLTTFKQRSIESYLIIPQAKPNMEDINTVTGTIDVLSYNVISTPRSMSEEGQNLTGYKLIVKGSLNVVVEYTALEVTQSVHSADYIIPFSVFIVLPPNYVMGSKFDVIGLVEDIYYKEIDMRTLFVNTTALINVKILGC